MSTATPGPSPDSGGGRPVMNQKLAFRIAVLGGIALVLLGVLLVRLWFLQVVGSEQYGLSATWMDGADAGVVIPMPGSVDSLNAAMAAGILLFEAVRQRSRR